ncbi:MAG: SGNH/GDSL hydrolase family protein [Chroococcales cyanobacterium]
MRSAPMAKQRPQQTLRVLLIGDSIANGAWWTDQDQTMSALMQGQLKSAVGNGFESVEVLNASANSWSPRNEVEYLRKFGVFDSQAVVLLINTDDLFGIAPNSLQVGRDRNYPSQKPPLALVEVLTYFVLPQKPIPGFKEAQSEKGDRVGFNLKAIEEIQAIANESNTTLILAMTPLLREIGQPGPRDYEVEARKRLQEVTEAQQIPYLDFLPVFNATEAPETLFRDNIHLSPKGNQLVSETIVKSLIQQGITENPY